MSQEVMEGSNLTKFGFIPHKEHKHHLKMMHDHLSYPRLPEIFIDKDLRKQIEEEHEDHARQLKETLYADYLVQVDIWHKIYPAVQNPDDKVPVTQYDYHKQMKRKHASYPTLPDVFESKRAFRAVEQAHKKGDGGFGYMKSVYSGFMKRVKNWEKDHSPYLLKEDQVSVD